MFEWRNLYRGFLMGFVDLLPGISGGTIAVILGIYQRFIEALSGIVSREWKRHLAFLFPLIIGALLALYFFSGMINWLFANYPNQLQFLFFGLIAGMLPFLFRKSGAKENFKISHLILLVIALVAVASMAFFRPDMTEPMTEFQGRDYIILFLTGAMASSAMILPGISGSFLMLLVGMYTTFTYSIEHLVFEALIPIGLGIVLGVLVVSKIIRSFFNRFYYHTYALIIGLVAGSLIVVYPSFEADMMQNVLSLICLIVGLLGAYLLGKVEFED